MRKLLTTTALALLLAGCQKTAENSTATANGADMAPVNASADGAEKPAYSIEKVSLPGDGRGDYLFTDVDGGKLYVTHTTALHVLDLNTLKPIATVDGLKYAHGVTVDDKGHSYVADGDAEELIQFDPATGKKTGSVKVGKKPDTILFDKVSGKIFVLNNDGSDISVVDPATLKVTSTIKMPFNPENGKTDDAGKIYINMEEGNAIAVIDTKAAKLDHVMKLDGCDGPAPLAIDIPNHRLFSGCGNKVMAVTDADSGKVITTLPIGGDPDGIVFDEGKRRIYVANRDKAWTIIDQKDKDTYAVEQTLPIDEYAKTVAIDPKTHRVFSSTADLVWPPKPTNGKKWLPNAKPGSFRLLVVSQK